MTTGRESRLRIHDVGELLNRAGRDAEQLAAARSMLGPTAPLSLGAGCRRPLTLDSDVT